MSLARAVPRRKVRDDGGFLTVQPAALAGSFAPDVGDGNVGDVLLDGGDEREERDDEEDHAGDDERAHRGDELHERIGDDAEEHPARGVHAVVARDEIAAVILSDDVCGGGIDVESPHSRKEHEREFRDLAGTRLDAEIEDDRNAHRRGDETIGKIRQPEEADEHRGDHVSHTAESAAVADEDEKSDEKDEHPECYPVARIGSHLPCIVHSLPSPRALTRPRDGCAAPDIVFLLIIPYNISDFKRNLYHSKNRGTPHGIGQR